MLEQMNLRRQLQLYLETKGMTASHLSRLSGVPKQSISGCLAGSNPRDVKQIKKVADALNVTVDNLLFGNGSAPEDRNDLINFLPNNEWISGLFEIKLRRVTKL